MTVDNKNQISTWRDWNRALPCFDFSSADLATLNSADIIGKLITGLIPKVNFKRNFQRCAFRNSVATGLEWPGVDYKDTVFIEAQFTDCVLGDGSTVSCTFTNCRFERCSFNGSAIHGTSYIDCSFIESDFSHSMFRESQISSCQFIRCVTSNKLFDGCQLGLNRFDSTSLDFRVILDNFGLDKTQIEEALIREDRSYPQDRPFDFVARSQDGNWFRDLSSFDKLKIQFYLDGGGVYGSDDIDSLFEPQEWINAVRAPLNLMHLLQDFSDFLLRLYADDKLSVIFVVKMAQLSNSLWKVFSENQVYSQVANAAAGIYLACMRWLEELDSAIEFVLNPTQTELRLRSFDDTSDEDIGILAETLGLLLTGSQVQITPRNSPVDIVVSHITPETVTFLVTLFFCTKTRLRLSRTKRSESTSKRTDDRQLINVSLGGAKGVLHNAVSVQSALPGSLFIRFDVDYSSALIEKLRRTIKEVI